MAHMSTAEVQAWLESTKAAITSIDGPTESQIAAEVLGRLAQTYGQFTSGWTDSTNTPQIVRQVISMYYAGWFYDKEYSEVVTGEATTSYGATLRGWATTLLADIISGSVEIVEIEPSQPATGPIFYPTDTSSTMDAFLNNTDTDDHSLGPAKFGMGMVF